jgi:hypothetical protein
MIASRPIRARADDHFTAVALAVRLCSFAISRTISPAFGLGFPRAVNFTAMSIEPSVGRIRDVATGTLMQKSAFSALF